MKINSLADEHREGPHHAWPRHRAARAPRSYQHRAWAHEPPQQELRLTEAGAGRLQAARDGWGEAQTRFAAAFGAERTVGLRAFLREVSAANLPAAPAANG
jgi:hypothetical protein